jgi:hypothetical protein
MIQRTSLTQASPLKIGYAGCSTDKQDLAAQQQALIVLAVDAARIYTDASLTGTNRDWLGLAQALAAVRAGDTLVVPKLARSVPDARAIAAELEVCGWRWGPPCMTLPIRWDGCSSISLPPFPSSRPI